MMSHFRKSLWNSYKNQTCNETLKFLSMRLNDCYFCICKNKMLKGGAIWSIALLLIGEIQAFGVEYRSVGFVSHHETQKSSFFGYVFALENIENRVLVTCPGCNTENDSLTFLPPTVLLRCKVNYASFTSSCINITPPSSTPIIDDGYSINFAYGWQRKIVACSVLEATLCDSSVHQLGNCYIREALDFNWSPKKIFPHYNCPHQRVDIIFLLDGSSSINKDNPKNFDTMKQWVKNVTMQFDISQEGTASVGVIQFSTYLPQFNMKHVVTEIPLGEYKTFKRFSAAVDRIVLHKKTTFTAAALRISVDEFATSPFWKDELTRKVLILVTDGRSNDHDEIKNSSEYIHSLNITTICVGIKGADLDELQIVANRQTGNNNNVYHLDDFDKLDKIVDAILVKIGENKLEVTAEDKGNGLRFSENGFSMVFQKVCY